MSSITVNCGNIEISTDKKKLMSLNNKILEAHQNRNFSLLVELYQEAAENVSTLREQNFFRVQAYIYALEVGHHLTPILHKQLISEGVEE